MRDAIRGRERAIDRIPAARHFHATNPRNVESRIVGTEDVRTALAFVERGECALGIVYKTDALLSKKVKVVAAFPAASHASIEYPGALTKNAGAESKDFWDFLQSDQAKVVFTRYGFSLIN